MAWQNLTVWRDVQSGGTPTAHASLGVVVMVIRRDIVNDQLPLEVFPGFGHLFRDLLRLFPRRHQGIPVSQGPTVELNRRNLDPSRTHLLRQFHRSCQLVRVVTVRYEIQGQRKPDLLDPLDSSHFPVKPAPVTAHIVSHHRVGTLKRNLDMVQTCFVQLIQTSFRQTDG